MSRRNQAGPWFGELLVWQMPIGERHLRVARYAGREHTIEHLDRADADQHNTYRGWHLLEERDGMPGQLSGYLGHSIARARRSAEVRIVAGGLPYNTYGQPRSLHSVVSGQGPIVDVAGESLVLWPDHDAARVTVHRYYQDPATKQLYPGEGPRGPIVAVLRPEFTLPDQPATTPIGITWQVKPSGSFVRSGYATWDDAYTALAELLAADRHFGRSMT